MEKEILLHIERPFEIASHQLFLILVKIHFIVIVTYSSLGLYLTDLVFIDDGNEDLLPENGLINFAKLSLIANVIRDMQQHCNTPYCLESVDVIRDWLLHRTIISNQQELYNLSLLREPRVPKRKMTVKASEEGN